MFLRPGTPVSKLTMSELPSPRTSDHSKELLSKVDLMISKSELRQRKVARNRAWLHSEASVFVGGKTRYKEVAGTILETMREQRKKKEQVTLETDFRKIVNIALA